MAGCLCDQCAALCCRYIALPIDNPDTRRDYDNIRWYLIHDNIVIFIQKRQWYVGILNRCKHLQSDNRCGIYESRPRICRSYSTDNCDYHGGEYDYDRLFTSADDLLDYAAEQLGKRVVKRTKPKPRGPATPPAGRPKGRPAGRPGRENASAKTKAARLNGSRSVSLTVVSNGSNGSNGPNGRGR